MKKISLSLSVILTMAALISSGTYAIFSDTDTIENNTISAATVDIDAKGEADAETLPKPIEASGLIPGEFTDWFRGVVFNQGDTSVRVWMYVDNLEGEACDVTNLELRTGHAGGNELERLIFSGALQDLEGEGNRVEITGTPPFDILNPGISQVVQQRAQLDESAGNEVMGQSCTWDEVFVGEAVEN